MEFIKKHITLGIILLYMILTLGFVSGRMNSVLCENVNVSIADSVTYRFVKPEDIVNLLKTMELKIWGYPVFNIKTHNVEKLILNNMPLVEHACAYADVDGTLQVSIRQRRPIARIITKTGFSYYLGESGHVLPLSAAFTARVPVVSGDIYYHPKNSKVVTIDSLVKKNGAQSTMLDEVFKIITHIHNDEVLNRQIEHIYVNKNEFEMIPKVGTHVIEFGTIENMENKFLKLKVIYYKGFSNLGWNKYSRVNLKYKNQVVCTKR